MLFIVRKYLGFYFTAKTKYGIHSPFVFDFFNQVYDSNTSYYSFVAIEYVREKLKSNSNRINVEDFGAGSRRFGKGKKRKISKIAATSLQQPKMTALLFRLINYYNLKPVVLELGTSLGITTAYLSNANKNNTVYTIEGSKEIAKVANNVFKQLALKNVKLVIGNFDMVLPRLEFPQPLGFVYIDGNHKKEATLSYFNWALEKANEQTIIVVDDIYWSNDMIQAWDEIKENERVSLTIDLFKLGIVFLHKVQVKEHFKLKKTIF
ncbi:MAG: SAM-dependent methyltransferase [Crocinitomicaceae bacterium]|nr:SAM-dependent methyltransferase [Crocinitomicaceae bacterium]|tara:strand:- start:8402 stop:9193 length:792 start_codon:yes stop_codon:yes gene_type:complete